ncbi:MAG: hypothetical protein HC815_39825 [Richelia sp. RM1_1_1]|nr:hypothetical protein [Richelia sp. RM1_1_1]
MSEGIQEHTLMAFWNYILLSEITHKIILTELSFAERDSERFERFSKLKEMHELDNPDLFADFSQRLLLKIEKLQSQINSIGEVTLKTNLTELIYQGDINILNKLVCDYLREKNEVWVLFDNIDKGWPTRGASTADIMIVRSLLYATRKLQRQLDSNNVNLKCLIF